MDTRPPDKLIAKWRAEYAADLQERVRQALADFDRKWSRDTPDNQESPAPSKAAVPNDSQNGSGSAPASTLSARQMVLKVMPDPGETVNAPDLRDEIVERWPEADTKYLGSRISQVLKQMHNDGKLDFVSRGPRIQDPVIYRVKESAQEPLVKSGP